MGKVITMQPAGPREIAVLQHAKLISHAEIEFEESANHPHNRQFSNEEMASAFVTMSAETAADAISRGNVKMSAACATVAAHIATKYNLQPEPEVGLRIRYANAVSDPMGTRELSRLVKVLF